MYTHTHTHSQKGLGGGGGRFDSLKTNKVNQLEYKPSVLNTVKVMTVKPE